jgi:hypothetical protein
MAWNLTRCGLNDARHRCLEGVKKSSRMPRLWPSVGRGVLALLEFGPLAKAGNRSQGDGQVVELLERRVPRPARGPYPAQPDVRPAVYGRFGNVFDLLFSPLEAGFPMAWKLESMCPKAAESGLARVGRWCEPAVNDRPTTRQESGKPPEGGSSALVPDANNVKGPNSAGRGVLALLGGRHIVRTCQQAVAPATGRA